MHLVTRAGLRVRRRVWAYGAVSLAAIGLMAAVSTVPLDSGRSEVHQVRRGDVAIREVLDLRSAQADVQVFIEPEFAKLSSAPTLIDPVDIGTGARLSEAEAAQAKEVVATLDTLGLHADARAIAAANKTFIASLTALGPLISGRPADVIASVTRAENAAYVQVRAVTMTAVTRLRTQRDLDAQESENHLEVGRRMVLAVDAAAALLVVITALAVGRRARRRELAERTAALRQEYESMLQQALEMSKTETGAYSVMTRALRSSVPHLQVEMLVADSSRSHFRQTMHTGVGPDQRSGCGVVSPLDCPATMHGHTMLFPSSTALNACPYLTGRASGELSAACVPISTTGTTVGVVHATAPDGSPPDESEIRYLEISSRRASERIAMLRAFEKSEAQARTDPLTGLWNRRSLEDRVNDLRRDGTEYALAYGDLDFFKTLNDTFGHEAGDQALRLFARVLRDAIRPNDLTARYGGEEFLVVLPDCPIELAAKILERLREQLALTLTSGRVPAFTVSFGLASSLDADAFDEVVALADKALLAAKAAGRNRTVYAGEPVVVGGDVAE